MASAFRVAVNLAKCVFFALLYRNISGVLYCGLPSPIESASGIGNDGKLIAFGNVFCKCFTLIARPPDCSGCCCVAIAKRVRAASAARFAASA